MNMKIYCLKISSAELNEKVKRCVNSKCVRVLKFCVSEFIVKRHQC